MALVKSTTTDRSAACKAGYADFDTDTTRNYDGQDRDAYALGRWIASRGGSRPYECIVHVLDSGVRHYMVRSDEHETGAVFTVFNADPRNATVGMVFRSALEAGYR